MTLGRRSPTLSGDSIPDHVGLCCRGCGAQYPPSLQYACPDCLGPLDVTYDPAAPPARLDRAAIEAGPRSIWRYADLLPARPGPGDLAPGFTPLVPAPRLAAQAAEAFGWGFVNVNLRPWYAEGSKTVGLEVGEQLGWSLPDHVVVPIASGALLTKVHQGFRVLARTTGVFGETAAGVTVATTARLAAAGAFAPGERVVVLVTGHGLKTREVLEGRAGATVTVRPNIDALEEALTPLTPELLVPAG